MEFDKSRVYTAVNADELQPGSKVIVANSLGVLREKFFRAKATTKLQSIKSEYTANRFEVAEGLFLLAYLVEESAKLKWTDLKIGDIIKNGSTTAMVTAISSEKSDIHILAGDVWFDDIDLKYWEKVNENNN